MTSNTAVQYMVYELENRWTPSVTDRANDVPQPPTYKAADEDVARVTQQHDDVIFVTDGDVSATPRSFGWSEKKIEETISIDIRTSVNRRRLKGGRDNNNDPERYGGLRGECERILDSVRRGHKEYDWIDGYEFKDISEDVGYGFWRGVWEVRLTQLAPPIDPST